MTYLNPQVSLTDEEIKEKLLNHHIYVEQRDRFLKDDEEPIPESFYQQIVSYLEKQQIILNPSLISPEIGYKGYQWTQTDNKILITYVSDTLEKRVNINGDRIQSDFISGILYRAPQDFKVTTESSIIKIELTVNEKWPILIVGGDDIDLDSIYIMTFSTLHTCLYSLSRRLLLHNAMRNHYCSIFALSFLSLGEGDKNASFYWNIILYLNCKKQYPTAFAVICEILMGAEDKGSSAILAENILIENANENVPNAFLYLGFLHLNDIEGFQSNNSLAFQYFKEAGEKYKIPKALDTLGRMFLFSIGVNQDIEAGFKYLNEADLPKDQIIDLLKKAEVDEAQIQFLFDEKNKKSEIVSNESDTKKKPNAKKIIIYSVLTFSAALLLGYNFIKRRK
ncbi:hypothetical protein M9Y10_038269 [Tritrichomonas musculus]|uniref:Sel1 repeat family protein n=1 Tax=Tritrichomonas musculus TaxID=1915356 RepID=A0ABR2K7Y4_9EUKA